MLQGKLFFFSSFLRTGKPCNGTPAELRDAQVSSTMEETHARGEYVLDAQEEV
jgi:hypothetical protein